MGIPETQNLETHLKQIQTSGVDVEVYFDGGSNIVGKISCVGSDFVELDVRIPGGSKKAICPFCSIRYLGAAY